MRATQGRHGTRGATTSVPFAAHAAMPSAVAAELAADAELGLTTIEADARLARYGANQPRRQGRPPYARLALKQLLDPLVALLLAATVVSIAIGDTLEGGAIAAVLVVNGALGFFQEVSAERAIRALSHAFTQRAVVVRGGTEIEIEASRVVPGDLLVLEEGDRVAADGRLIEVSSLEADESALTGESLPVAKGTDAVAVTAPLAERRSMLHAGTGITRGRGRALVVATGAATELGQIQTLAAAAKPPPTPLEQRLARLARQMVAAGVALTLLLALTMLLRGEDLHEAFLVGVAVAVAAVPEGLAATVTAALALGARAMARRGAIVRRLDAIETLGETTVICTDKTGTLTENQIRVAALRPADGVTERELLEAAVLASSAHHVGGDPHGDPLEVGLLLAALERGIEPEVLRAQRRLVHELPFDSERKRMTRVYADGDVYHAYSKGAPEVLVHAERDMLLLDAAACWAGEGFRVLAIARRPVADEFDERLEEAPDVLGLVALHDPLRETSASSIDEARRAGIEVRMLTGDHPATARTIGRAIGLDESAILARVTPADKLALVEELQRRGEVVAMTGDGVNDAPALRRADVGVAMGRSGTEAAREAAAIVLTGDDFATIVAAVREGRRVGDNIRKFVAFLLSANLGEVLVFAVAIVAGLGAPLAVIQVLVVNLVTDGLPALALARDPAAPETMALGPRRGKQLFDRGGWLSLAGVGLLVGGATFAAFLLGRALDGDAEQTMAFATLALSELAVVFGVRSPTTAAWRLPANRWLLVTALLSAVLVVALVYLPLAHGPFATVSLGWVEALVAGALALVPLVGVELGKWALRSRPKSVRANQ